MKTLTQVAEALLKLTGIFIAFGYMSLRAHLAVLGIPWDYPLGVERYLAEAFQLTIGIIGPAIEYLPRLIIAVTIAIIGIEIARKEKHLASLVSHVQFSMRKLQHSVAIPFALILLAFFFYYKFIRDIDEALMTPFVGPLRGLAYYSLQGIFTSLVIFCLVSYVLYDRLSSNEYEGLSWSARVVWQVLAASLGVLIFYIPIVYGTLWHPMQYPAVKVSLKGSRNVSCGILVLQAM
jgi:hypothetical protein